MSVTSIYHPTYHANLLYIQDRKEGSQKPTLLAPHCAGISARKIENLYLSNHWGPHTGCVELFKVGVREVIEDGVAMYPFEEKKVLNHVPYRP
eukprot:scaffold69125_cov18-Tisochrysis_lutea.AAC.1